MVNISGVAENSIAEKAGIKPGDMLVTINGRSVHDVIDYRFFITEKRISLKLSRGEKDFSVNILKGQYCDLGLEFESYLMDDKKRCRNNCVFCFVDQNPEGMRETVYFKDDDERLSFLCGNYITLTNLTDCDIDRIIEMHISPINVSVHTTNPSLREKMMNNRFAGDIINRLKKLCDGGISVNAQIVLCRGYNDGSELDRTMNELLALFPKLQSVAVVPSGITGHREGLPALSPYDKASAAAVLKLVVGFGDKCVASNGHRLFFPSDEFYLLAEVPLPGDDFYEGYMQLDNGVGMLRSLEVEFNEALRSCKLKKLKNPRKVTIATGEAAGKELRKLCSVAEKHISGLRCNVIPVKNIFFGGAITVSGLVVGKDIYNRLHGTDLGDELLIPRSMLRSEGDLFLDDMSLKKLSEMLNIKITPVQNNGSELLDALLGVAKKHER